MVLRDSNNETEQSYDYHKHNLTYIGDYIKFADGKAGVALGATLVVIGFFGKITKENGFEGLTFWDYGLLIGLLPLIVSVYFFIWGVLWPRYTKKGTNYISWDGIASFKDSKSYLKHLEKTSNNKFIEDLGRQNHTLAVVCLKKYNNLRYGFIGMTLGVSIEILSWFFSD